jgi:hypothetical protein
VETVAVSVLRGPQIANAPGSSRSPLGGHTVAVEGRQRLHLLANTTTSTSSATANHTGQLIRRNSGEPVERPLQLVAPDRGGVYLDKRLAGLERGHVDRFVAASTPGMWSRIASIVRGPATSGSTLWTDRIRAGKGCSGTGNGEIVTTRLNSVAFIVVEALC